MRGRGSRQACHHAFQACEEFLPSVLGALVGLLLIRPEARLLHAQVGPLCSTARTLQSTEPQSARRLKWWSTTSMKSFFMSHSSIRCGCVSARQIFSGGKGTSRSTTTESDSVDVSFIRYSAWISRPLGRGGNAAPCIDFCEKLK